MKAHTLTAFGLLSITQQSLAFPAFARDAMPEALPEAKAAGHEQLVKRVGFNPTLQYVSNTGAHAFVAPGSGDQRGPCPGLNAMANHGYLPHNGVATIAQFIAQTNAVFGMGIDLATFLATYGAVIDGNGLSWSIGGPTAAVPGLLGTPQGISGSHNKYESDASPTRGDLYLYGNDYLVQLNQFQALYNKQSGVDNSAANYDLNILTQFRAERFAASKANNPYFFNGPFTGVAVQPAAYTFIYRFMANKSAEHPEGVLNKNVLKSFFSITGDDSNLQYTPGWERIPDNWYKRAIGDEYTIPYFSGDLLAAAIAHPEFLDVGGNTGTPNSFVGVDIKNLTGGVYNAQNLLQGNNLACFGFQAAAQGQSDLAQALNNAASGLACPTLSKIDNSQFSKYPGYTKLNANGAY